MALRAHVYTALNILTTLFVLWNTLNPLAPMLERGIFLLLLLLLVFWRDVANPGRDGKLLLLDFLMIAATVIIFGYIVVYHEQVIRFVGVPPQYAIFLGLAAIFVILEATRRAFGWALTFIVIGSLVYGFWGHWLPRFLGGHPGYELDRIINTIYLTMNGIYGDVTYVLLKYVFLFVLFGKVLEHVGAVKFVMDLSLALVGKIRGGPAMVSTISSGFLGSVSGSAIANVMITGVITIPMMKKIGFKPHVAGGVEAAASTGGQFMPPVMGAVAFLIVEFIQVDYVAVISAALIPAILYYLSILVAIYVYAKRSGIEGLPPSQIPKLKDTFRGLEGLIFFVGIGILVTLLILRYSPMFSVLYAMLGMVVLNLFSKKRITLKQWGEVFAGSSQNFTNIGVAGGSIGILVGMVLLTGLATRFSSLILGLVGDNLVFALVLTMLASIVLGTGLPTTVTYILLAIMVAPALVGMDVLPLAAHLYLFFAGMMAMVTPPVAMAAFAAATIAQSNFWKTSVAAWQLALPAYLLPFAFVLDNALLMIGTPLEILHASVTAAIGVSLLSIAIIGDIKETSEWLERGAMLIAALLLVYPGGLSDLVGFCFVILAVVRPLTRYFRRDKSFTTPSA